VQSWMTEVMGLLQHARQSAPSVGHNRPRVALDMSVLAGDVRAGIWRVCDELFARLISSQRLDIRTIYRRGQKAAVAKWLSDKGLAATPVWPLGRPSNHADILVSPFGVAPRRWLADPRIMHAHFVYDLIGVYHPEFFNADSAKRVVAIMQSLRTDSLVFAISESTKRDLLRFRPDLTEQQVRIVPLAAGPQFKQCEDEARIAAVRQRFGLRPTAPYMLSVATLEVRKNLHRVIEAYIQHRQQNKSSELQLVLSGFSGWKREKLDAALANAGHWRDDIIVTGFVDEKDLSPLISGATCFTYLSLYEGFGLPILEAMACGTPVVAADNSSIPEVTGDAAILVDANDVSAAASAISQVVTDATLRRRLSAAGLARAALFDWDRSADIVINALIETQRAHSLRPSPKIGGLSQTIFRRRS
jgi:glycosyltransferase involved in cell wall biosynthesis